jgi:hypothetical protein
MASNPACGPYTSATTTARLSAITGEGLIDRADREIEDAAQSVDS